MEGQATKQAGGSDKIVEQLLRRVSKDQIRQLVDLAKANSGEVIGNLAFEPGDDICPTFRFPIPFPPKFDQFLQQVTTQGHAIKVFPYGILNPEAILVQVGLGNVAR